MQFLYDSWVVHACLHNTESFRTAQTASVIDLDDFNFHALELLDKAWDPCEVTLQWIQRLMGEADRKPSCELSNSLRPPPPWGCPINKRKSAKTQNPGFGHFASFIKSFRPWDPFILSIHIIISGIP